MGSSTSSSSTPSYRLWFFLLVGLALVAAFAFQGSRGLYESTEGRYAEAAREMMERKNYLEPTLNYEPHWTKPPLAYWGIIAGLKVFGVNAWGARLYLGFALFFTVLTVYGLGKTLWDRKTGLVAGLIYLSSVLPVAAANSVSTDMLLTLWITLAILFYFLALRETDTKKQFGWILVMWLNWALAFLTKGPPALLPLAPLIIWHFAQRGRRPFLFHPLGVLTFLVAGFSWYVIVCLRNEGLLSYFLGREVWGRVVSEEDRNPEWFKPFTIYLPALTIGAGVWFFPAIRLFIKKGLYDPLEVFSHIRRRDISSFLLLWVLVPLIVFFMSKSRLIFYVLPLYAPVALATARWMVLGANGGRIMRKILVYAVIMVAVIVFSKGFLAHYPTRKDMKAVYELMQVVRDQKPVYHVVEQEKAYGLQFYMNGPLRRVTIGDKRSWADAKLKRSLKTLQATPDSQPYAYILSKKNEDRFKEQLSKSRLPYKRYENKLWVVYLVKPSSPGL